MYVIAIMYNGNFTNQYVKWINYKKECWDSGINPKVFKSMESVLKCIEQINKWAPSLKFRIYLLNEF